MIIRLLPTETGLNPYDVRLSCDRSENKDGPLCYKQMGWIETWMNEPSNKAALGVNPSKDFASCNMEVNQAFSMNGDGMHNSAALLPELVDAGVRLLVYAGNAGEFLVLISAFSFFSNRKKRNDARVSMLGSSFSSLRWKFVVPNVGEDAAAVVTRCMVGLLIAECSSGFTLSGSPDHRVLAWCQWCAWHGSLPTFASGGAQCALCSRNTFYVGRWQYLQHFMMITPRRELRAKLYSVMCC
jgi:hypothetical protein